MMRKLEKKLDIIQAISSLPLLAVSLNLKYDERYLKNDLQNCHRCRNHMNQNTSKNKIGSIVLCISNKLSKLYPYVICSSCASNSSVEYSSAIGNMKVEILEVSEEQQANKHNQSEININSAIIPDYMFEL